MRLSTAVFGLIVTISATAVWAADAPVSAVWGPLPASAFDRVASGTIVVYPIDDLTDGRQDSADQIAKLVRDTISPGHWEGQRPSAASCVTPRQLTIKAESEDHQSIRQLLTQLHETQNLFIRVNYELVDAQTRGQARQRQTIINPLRSEDFNATNRVVGDSLITIHNGDQGTLLDGGELSLPTLLATATLSADRKAATFRIVIKDGKNPDDKTKPVLFSLPLDQTIAISIPTQADTRWLILTPTLVERDWMPGGTARLIGRE
jgi:hypothetical protein